MKLSQKIISALEVSSGELAKNCLFEIQNTTTYYSNWDGTLEVRSILKILERRNSMLKTLNIEHQILGLDELIKNLHDTKFEKCVLKEVAGETMLFILYFDVQIKNLIGLTCHIGIGYKRHFEIEEINKNKGLLVTSDWSLFEE